MILRDARAGDHPTVREIHRLAFGANDLAHGDTVADLVDALHRDDPTAAGFVAEQADGVVGHVLFSRGLLDAPRRLVEVVTLSPLAVVPEWQGRGIGSALIRHGLKELDERGVPLVFLEGNPAFYSQRGFSRADEHGFRRPSLRIPEGAFQVARLSAHEPWMTGTFVYSDAFWRHDCVGLRDPKA
jgi:putative acetyltransferase